MAKITKKDIKNQLDNIPIDNLLLGKGNTKAFTSKQKKFAKQVALGSTLSDAYRMAYDTEGKPSIVNSDASKLASNPKIAQLIRAYEDAIEGSKYRTPAQLRELVIHQLTITAIDSEVSVRDRLTAIKMLGTVSEVSAFTERKESLVIHESSKVKQQLLDQLKTIVSGEIKEVSSDIDEGEELLAKLAGVRGSKPDQASTYPEGIPPNMAESSGKPMHNIPHTESLSDLATSTVHENSTEGVGVVENVAGDGNVDNREGPPMEKGTPESGEGV